MLASGRTEYIEKAYPWIALFRARGFAVASFDFRGQGLSQRLLANRRAGYVDDFAEYQHDYDAAFDAMKDEVGDMPLLVAGHSMGGLATLRFLSRRQDEVAGAIMTAPMLGLALSRSLTTAAYVLSRSATALGLGARYVQGCDDRSGADRGFEDNVLTSDADRFAMHEAMLNENPDLTLGGTTHAWLWAGFREMRAMAALPAGWLAKPVLVLAAAEDRVVSNSAIGKFAAANPLAQIVMLDGSRHEPMMEVDAVQDAAWTAIDRWLGETLR